MMNQDALVDQMAKMGYYYDALSSYDDWLVFTWYGGWLDFDSWEAVASWLNGVVID